MNKNYEQIIKNDLTKIQMQFEENNPNIILCSKPFHKIEFLNKLINSTRDRIIFIDMDLLYTGYVQAQMIQKEERLTIISPDKMNWREKITEILDTISKERVLLIIDSINAIHNLFDELESARFINSCMMLLATVGNHLGSSVIITGVARRKNNSWKLSPSGRQVVRSERTGIYFLKKVGMDLIICTESD